MAMKNPPHPGLLIREDVMAPLGLSLDDAATRFGVEVKYLSAVLEGNESLNSVLATNLEKAGISTAKTWISLQDAFNQDKEIRNQTDQDEQIEPFFITEEIETEMIARGCTFEPPNHARTISLPGILASLSDDELAKWEGDFADEERVKRIRHR